jgi:hypothetical protein
MVCEVAAISAMVCFGYSGAGYGVVGHNVGAIKHIMRSDHFKNELAIKIVKYSLKSNHADVHGSTFDSYEHVLMISKYHEIDMSGSAVT